MKQLTRRRGQDRIGDLARINLIRDIRWFLPLVQCADPGANLLISSSNPFAGPKVVKPGLHDEGLVEMLGVGGVAIDAPANSAVAKSNATQPMNRPGKFGVVFRSDAVVDRDPHRPVGRLGGERQFRSRTLPLIRSVVREGALQNVEAAREW